VADRLNLNAVTDRIPTPFQGIFDPEKYRQAQAYLKANTRFGQITAAVDLLVLLAFWFGGGFAFVDGWTRRSAGGRWPRVGVHRHSGRIESHCGPAVQPLCHLRDRTAVRIQ
jgi:hypothetical protein